MGNSGGSGGDRNQTPIRDGIGTEGGAGNGHLGSCTAANSRMAGSMFDLAGSLAVLHCYHLDPLNRAAYGTSDYLVDLVVGRTLEVAECNSSSRSGNLVEPSSLTL